MGRKISFGEVLPNHSLLYFIFVTACITATIGIISSLCGLLERIKGSPDPSTRGNIKAKENAAIVSTIPDESCKTENVAITHGNEEPIDQSQLKGDEKILQRPLPPPPAIKAISCNLRTNSMAPNRVSRSNSSIKSLQRKLSTSMSMKAFSGVISCREKNSKLKHDDSIWKKQIILGEKCKVPDEDDAIFYDENGNRISSYHPKQLNAITMSRQSSEIDANAIPK